MKGPSKKMIRRLTSTKSQYSIQLRQFLAFSSSLSTRSLSSSSPSNNPFREKSKDGRGLSSYPALELEEQEQEVAHDHGKDVMRSSLVASQSNASSLFSPLLSVACSETKDENSLSKGQEAFNQNEIKKSQAYLSYVEGMKFPITSKLNIVCPDDDTPKGIWPVFRLMVISNVSFQLISYIYKLLTHSNGGVSYC